MNTKELTAQLVAMHAALVEKIDAQPFCAPSLKLDTEGNWRVDIWFKFQAGGDYGPKLFKADTPEASIQAAFDFIAAMPDPATKAKTDWHRKLGDVIDEGHALNLPDDVMTPLRGASQAMTENLIEGPK
jgi:hypothetical protein